MSSSNASSVQKREQTPFFEQYKSQNVYGQQPYADEIRDKMYVSNNMTNVLPFEPVQVSQIDEKDPLELSYAYCNQSACFVAEIIAENFVNLFKSGNQLIVKALLLDNREATITYSLSGFTAGYNRLLKEVSD